MGTDKSRLVIGGKTLAQHSATALSAVAGRVLVVGGRDGDSDGLPVIPDESASNGTQYRASIVGLYTAVKATQTEWSAVLACDLPFVTGELFERLASFIAPGICAVVPMQADGRLQPLCALYRRQVCLPEIEKMLSTGGRKLQDLLHQTETRIVGIEEIGDLPHSEHFFMNVNTPSDYAAAKAIAGER